MMSAYYIMALFGKEILSCLKREEIAKTEFLICRINNKIEKGEMNCLVFCFGI